MDFFNDEMEKEYASIGMKRKTPKVVTAHKRQTGVRKDFQADKRRKAMPPGKRISKEGNVYYEFRKNRTDIKGLGI